MMSIEKAINSKTISLNGTINKTYKKQDTVDKSISIHEENQKENFRNRSNS